MQSRISSRDIAAIAGGLAVGIIGSRLMMPVLAAGSGSVRGRLGQDPFERLIQDHRSISATLRKMEEAAHASTATRARLFLTLKRTLAKHAMAEEDVVYPILSDQGHSREDAKHLYDEHADMKIHLYELENMLKSGTDWTHRVRSLRTLIEGHIREEEDIQFPKLRDALGSRKVRQLSGQIHREEALVL